MRPDIDSLYNQGGWPSTLVLTAEGNIVSGGTYIPPEDMVSWLKKAVAAYRNDRHGTGNKRENKSEHSRRKRQQRRQT